MITLLVALEAPDRAVVRVPEKVDKQVYFTTEVSGIYKGFT